nr:hypothetical protein [Tanacetum cinerariifolium]
MSISKLRESLAVLEYNTYNQSQLSAIWIMVPGVPNFFTKLYTVEGSDMSLERLVGFRKSGAFIIERQGDCDDQFSCEIALYKPDSKQIRKIGIVGKTCSFSVHSYMETLLLLRQPNGIILYKEKVLNGEADPRKDVDLLSRQASNEIMLLAFTLIDLTFLNFFLIATQYWTVQPGKAEKSDMEK